MTRAPRWTSAPRWIGPVVCVGLLTLAACSSGTDATTPSEPRVSQTPAESARPPRPSQPAGPSRSSASPRVDKVLVFVVENHSLDQMRAEMPYTSSLAEKYGYTTSYRALTHPSLGNYIAIAGGSTFGIVDDRNPVAHQLHGDSVFSQARAAGGTAGLYAEGMPGTCTQENGGQDYAVRHNPWTYFVDDRTACRRYDVPADQLGAAVDAGRLPDIGMVIPDLCNDAHDCSLATADDWLHAELDRVLSGPDWRSGRLAVVVTADEDDHHQDNLVLTVVLHPGVRHAVVDAPLTHLSLSRFLSEVVGQQPLRDAAKAPSLGEAFGLRSSR